MASFQRIGVGQSPRAARTAASGDSKTCQAPYQFYHQQLDLQEKNGYEVVLTKFLAAGNDLSANIPDWFGSWRLAPLGTLQAGICWNISNAPKTLSYEIDGVDSEGNKITTTASIPFNPAPALPAGPLSGSVKTLNLNVAATQSVNSSVGVNIGAGVQWNASLFPA